MPQFLTANRNRWSYLALAIFLAFLVATTWRLRPVSESEAIAQLIAKGCDATPRSVIAKRRSRLADDDLALLRNMPELRLLLLGHARISDRGLEDIARLQTIESLSLRSTEIGDDGFEKLTGLRRLLKLDVGETNVTDRGANAIGQLRGLHELAIDRTAITSHALKSLTQLSSLESLTLSYLTDDGAMEVRKLPSLASLTTDFARITDVGLQHISQMEKLETFRIHGDQFTDQGLCELARLPRLRWLQIDGDGLTGDWLACFEKHDALQDLVLCSLTLDAAALRHIGRIPNLIRLHLYSCRIESPESLSELSQLDTLECVVLNGDESGGAVESRMKELLPGVRILTQ